ncbi:MAG TPA: hypothetical protein VG097_04195 [Gemmata sp.]|jgi:aspartokinase-like uncharacterized kinase|nr:hypothetical protein [Gemmata sp.]
MIVVKVGGSLFDHPKLGPGLHDFLKSLAPAQVMLIAGGGEFVECIRELDEIHGLPDEATHIMALQAMTVSATFLACIIDLPSFGKQVVIPDCFEFMREDLGSKESLPHSWDVTSDSIAARMALACGAERLVLLKSIDVPALTHWTEAAKNGWIDRHFPKIIVGKPISVEILNFRRHLDSFPE